MPEDTSSKKIDEASDSLNTKKFYLLLLFVSFIGIIGALMMIAFVFLQESLTAILWKDIPVDSFSPVFNPLILVICVAGGLGAGVIRHYFNGEIAIMAEDLIEFNQKGRFTLKQGLELLLRGLVSLVCGAPLGPEAPLTVATGAVGGSIAEKARMPTPVVTLSALSAISGFFGAFLTSPFAGALIFIETTLEKGIMTWKAVLPSIVAATAGFAVYFMISGSFIGSMFTLPPYGGFENIDLIYAVGLGLIGGLCGIFFIILYQKMRSVFEPMEHQPVLLGLIGGLGLGLTGMLFPLTLFMGIPPCPGKDSPCHLLLFHRFCRRIHLTGLLYRGNPGNPGIPALPLYAACRLPCLRDCRLQCCPAQEPDCHCSHHRNCF